MAELHAPLASSLAPAKSVWQKLSLDTVQLPYPFDPVDTYQMQIADIAVAIVENSVSSDVAVPEFDMVSVPAINHGSVWHACQLLSSVLQRRVVKYPLTRVGKNKRKLSRSLSRLRFANAALFVLCGRKSLGQVPMN